VRALAAIVSAQDMKLAAARMETYLGQFEAKTGEQQPTPAPSGKAN
jgi:hypothetical protein